MRSLRLARIAAQAELLRLRLLARRQGGRAVLGVVAAVFLLAFLSFLHVAAYQALALKFQSWAAALIVAGIDLLITGLFAVMAMQDVPSRAEREAQEVRRSAELQLAQTVAVTSLAGPVSRLLGARGALGVAVAALTARYLGFRL